MRRYLRMARVQNLPTAVADPLAGALMLASREGSLSPGRMLGLAGVSALLYSAGMVLNDVADVERDRALHPDRPLVVGQVPLARAAVVGSAMLFLALIGAMAIGFGAVFVATLIALFVVLYDFVLKKRRLAGCLGMGMLRGLNVALGMSALLDEAPPFGVLAGDELLRGPMLMAGYVTLLTLLSTFEEGRGARLGVPAVLVALSGVPIAALLLVPEPATASIVAAAISLFFLWKASLAVRAFDASRTGLLVRDGVRAIPVLDGALVMGYGSFVGGLLVAALVAPAILLGRWFKGA